MENIITTDTYTVSLEQRLSALTAERDSLRKEAAVLSEELQGLQAAAGKLSSERDTLQGVVERRQGELRQLRRMLFGRKSERFIPSDPAQLKLDFEGVAQLKQEREYAALQAATPTRHKEPAARGAKSAQERQRRIFSEHLERRDEIIEPEEIPAGGKRIGEEITELLEYKPGELYSSAYSAQVCFAARRRSRHRPAAVAAAAPHQCRTVAAGAVAGGQIPGSSAAAPSNWDSRQVGRAV